MHSQLRMKQTVNIVLTAISVIILWVFIRLEQEETQLGEKRQSERHEETVTASVCSFDSLARNLSESKTSFVANSDLLQKCTQQNEPDGLFLYKAIKHDKMIFDTYWPDFRRDTLITRVLARPGDVPETVHYVWCGSKVFRFEHYLSVLSAVKLIQPHKFLFHYYELPIFDEKWYHTWFIEMKQSLPSLELKKSAKALPCEGNASLSLVLDQLAVTEDGGIYIGENTLLTHLPSEWKISQVAAYSSQSAQSSSPTVDLLMAKPGVTMNQLREDISESKMSTCTTVTEFNEERSKNTFSVNQSPCVVTTSPIFPRDVLNSSDPFSYMARWLYYGNESKMAAVPENKQVVPRIGHMIFFHKDDKMQWPFYAYMSTLSAFYIAGIERLFVHGDRPPSGEWWDRLQGENITFVSVDRILSVFQQSVSDIHHQSDVLRFYILWKYGGVYQDNDVIWVNAIPAENWLYPTVTGVDWPKTGEWPEIFNPGLYMCKPGASYMAHILESFRLYLDRSWGFNSLLLPYRVYEQHPDTIFIDHRFQVICFCGICHPAWHEGYQKPIEDKSPTQPFDISEFSAFHWTYPNYPASMASLGTIKAGKDVFAEVGRKILTKSGRSHELEEA